MRSLLIFLITAYQRFISPLLPAHCRFYPTCSAYAADAVREHGIARGLALAMRRIGRCHPWNDGGVDPAPTKKCSHDSAAHGAPHG